MTDPKTILRDMMEIVKEMVSDLQSELIRREMNWQEKERQYKHHISCLELQVKTLLKMEEGMKDGDSREEVRG